MKAAVVVEPHRVEIETVADPTPAAGEVVVEVAATGICGTDLHILKGEHAPSLPLVPGHEVAGVVVAVGTGVDRLAAGARVAVDPTLPCHTCRYCRQGRTNLCESLGAIGVSVAGGAAEFVAVPAPSCVVLPEHVSTADAALIEPLSCVVHALDILKLRLDARVLIYGAGTMGLIILELVKRTGVASVDVVELNAARLETARQLGCSASAASADEFDGGDWDVVVDVTGNAAAIADGLGRIASGGTFMQFGVPSPDTTVTITPYDVYHREITILGSMAILDSFGRAAELFAAGAIDPGVLITDRVPLDDYAAAIARFASGGGLKTVVEPASAGA